MVCTTFLLLFSCGEDKESTVMDTGEIQEEIIVDDPVPEPTCGDGEINQPEEECDDGASNSNTQANACRENCILPSCGDNVLDDLTEECDDGNFWNQDGWEFRNLPTHTYDGGRGEGEGAFSAPFGHANRA